MRTSKSARPAAVKSVVETEGTFEAVVSVFDVVDYANDRVKPGAFVASLARWKSSGDPIPVIWSHAWEDPFSFIGAVLDAAERPDGLWVRAKVDLDVPVAAQVFRLLAERRVREFSFAYDVLQERRAPDGVNDLVELDIIEVGPTLKGCNPATELLAVKSRVSPRQALRAIEAFNASSKRHERRQLSTPADFLAELARLEA